MLVVTLGKPAPGLYQEGTLEVMMGVSSPGWQHPPLLLCLLAALPWGGFDVVKATFQRCTHTSSEVTGTGEP